MMEACRHYWNTCLPLAGSALDRELLQQPLSELLGLVASLVGGRGWKKKNVSSLPRGREGWKKKNVVPRGREGMEKEECE